MNKYPAAMKPTVTTLFDEATNTVTYIVADPATAPPMAWAVSRLIQAVG
jgi:hypothetical protein